MFDVAAYRLEEALGQDLIESSPHTRLCLAHAREICSGAHADLAALQGRCTRRTLGQQSASW